MTTTNKTQKKYITNPNTYTRSKDRKKQERKPNQESQSSGTENLVVVVSAAADLGIELPPACERRDVHRRRGLERERELRGRHGLKELSEAVSLLIRRRRNQNRRNRPRRRRDRGLRRRRTILRRRS